MKSQKPTLVSLLAVAALTAAGSGVYSYSKPEALEITRKRRRNENMAHQKTLVEQRLTTEQQACNAAVEAKRTAKKARLK